MSVSQSGPREPTPTLVRSLVTPEGVDLRLTLASAGERAGALLLDLLVIVVALFILTLLAIAAVAAMKTKSDEVVEIIWFIGFFVLRSGYFFVFELTGRAATPGKRALGLRVVARDGGRLTSEAIFSRNALREIEIFLPLTFLFAPRADGGPVDGLVALMAILWTGVFALFPLFNRDKLRMGDIVAGTWVVKAPRLTLLPDLAVNARSSVFAPAMSFTPEQVNAYGVKELEILEDVLRRRDARTLKAVASRIQGKIGWTIAPGETDAAFLTAYYAALRGRLEHRLLFGHRRRDKFDKA